MPISFSCPRCGKKLKAPDDAVGKTSRCPGCGTSVTCPEPVYDAELVDAPPGGEDPYTVLEPEQPYALVGSEPGIAPRTEGSPGEARRPCPMCGEMIVATAAKCRFCGEIFDPTLKRARRTRKEEEDLSTGDIVVALLCGWIGCIAGIVWMIQGKPKGWKMLLLSFVSGIVGSVIWNLLLQQGAVPR
jgi:predicted RNA-binding Zn-ribbon protein involved in translation (DUF1610 family)